MTDQTQPPDDGLQFDKADASAESTAASTAGPVCAQCQTPIASYYFETAGRVVCDSCKRAIESSTVTGVDAAGFGRAVLFGLAGAVAGAAVYYGVLAATGYEIGLIAILVGFMVGYMVRRGSGGRGGRRYQVLALALTYLAIGSTYVPMLMRAQSGGKGGTAESSDSTLASALTPDPSPVPGEGNVKPPPTLLVSVGALVLVAAAMPLLVGFADLPSSLISLLIIGVALRQAWIMNGASMMSFSGPYQIGAGPGPGAPPD